MRLHVVLSYRIAKIDILGQRLDFAVDRDELDTVKIIVQRDTPLRIK